MSITTTCIAQPTRDITTTATVGFGEAALGMGIALHLQCGVRTIMVQGSTTDPITVDITTGEYN